MATYNLVSVLASIYLSRDLRDWIVSFRRSMWKKTIIQSRLADSAHLLYMGGVFRNLRHYTIDVRRLNFFVC